MMRTRCVSCFLILVVFAALQIACSRGPSEEELKLNELRQQLADIKQGYQELQQARNDVEAAKNSLAELEAIAESDRTDEQKTQIEEVTAGIGEAEEKSNANYEGVQSRLQEFLTTALNDFPTAPETLEGLNLYSDEAILNAEEIVRKSGHYSKAIETLETAKSYYEMLQLSVHQPLADKITELDDWQFITQERFDQIKKGMTEEEVIEIAGVVYVRNVQEDPKTGVVTWLYKTREGNAAAVYFKKNKKVYNMKWDVLKTRIID